MKRLLLLALIVFGVASASFSQTITRTANIPTSVSIDGGPNYASSLPTVNFSQSDFSQGCLINDVQVSVTWVKTRGGCGVGEFGNSQHQETSFRLDGPTGQEVLVRPNYYGGDGNMASAIVTIFDQDFGGLPTVAGGTPQAGSFRPTDGNLNNFDGDPVTGTWALRAGDNNGGGDPLCVSAYSVTITTSPDNTAPVFTTFPSSTTVNNDPGQCGAVVSWNAPTASDLCGVTILQTAGLASGSLFPIGTTTVTYRATDSYNNITNQSFTVTVNDTENPTVNCPANFDVNAPFGSCSANVTFTAPTAADNCPGATVAQSGGPTSGSTFSFGDNTITFTATDASGNTADCSFVVEVLDIEDPQITCPANINVFSTLGNCGSIITYTPPVGTDNCAGVTTSLSGGLPSGLPFPSGPTVVSYLAIDGSGNTASCSFTVTVDPAPNGDMTIPATPVCQGDQTVITFDFSSSNGTPPYNVSITDGVSVFNVSNVVTGSTYTVTPPTSVTYSFVSIQDATGCARTSGFTGTASVVVTPIPIVSFTGLDAVYCESDATVNLTGNQAGGTFFGTGVTNLGGGSGTFSPSAAGPTGPYDVTYEYTDLNNCTDSDVQQVSVDAQPVADAGSGGSECDLDFTFSAVASVGIGTWTTVSGPGLPFFSNINSPTSIVQVSAPGSYVFQWTEVNGECSDSEQITVVFNDIPVADAGFGGAECDFDFVLGANPSVGTGTWTSQGPGNASFSPSANDPNATVTVDAPGSYTLTWTEDNNGCTDSESITVTFDQLPVANAGSGGNECDLNFTFNAVPTVGVGTWTGVGPGAITFNAPNSPTSTVTVSNYGTYTFTWTEVSGNCVSVDQVTVNFYQQPNANAGSGGSECDLDFTFSAVPSVGNGAWTLLNGPGTPVFSNSTSATSNVTVDQYGTYTFTWTETNGTCTDFENVVVSFYEQPVANAGVGGNECDLDFSLNGVASAGTGLWTYTGPGTATFVSDINAATDVSVSAYGTYVFTWTETNGTCSDAASVTVNFYQQPVANAGLGGDECDLTFLAQAIQSVGSGQWTQSSGPGTATFSNSTSPVTNITVDTYGTYEFTWTETNGTCSDARSVTVNFYEQPVADAGTGGNECDLDFDLTATASVGSGLWTSSGPGTANFSDDTDPNAIVTVSQSGAYTFTWTETNGSCSDSDDVLVNLYDQPVADAGSGGDECDLTFTFSAVPSFGTGTWTASGPGNASYSNANSATGNVTVDAYGTYTFTWTEVNGPCSDAATITVNFYQQPVANAGSGGSECDLDFDLDATPSVGNGVWTYSGPGTATFSPTDTDPDATVTVDATGQYTFTWTEDNNGCTDSDDAVVDFHPLPTVSFSGLAASYCIDQTTPVPLTGSPAGGTFSGLGISGNSFVPSVAGVGTIFITYTYTDGNGCTNSETQTVDVNGLPSVSFSGLDPEYCEDDANAYTLTGSPSGGTFSGLGITGDDFVPSDAGSGSWTINYTYTDPFGCTSSDDQLVVVNELPVVSFSGLAASYCEDASSVNLTGSPAGGVFSGDGVIGAQFSPVSAGVGLHSVTYTYTDGNGCVNSQTQQVTVNDVPLPMITPSGVSEICDGDDLVLNAGSGYSVYNWSNNTNGQTTTVTSAGTYNVIVTTAQGCSGTSAPIQVVVNPLPVVDLGNDTTICTASVLNLDAGNAGADYSWSTFEITQTINVTSTGVYIVDVTDGNGCVGSDAISVTVADLLDPTIVSNGPLTFCNGDSVTLDAGAGYNQYLWNSGEQTQTITVSTSGIYEVQVWDQFGCEGGDNESVAVLQLPNAVVTPAGPVSICEGDTTVLSASSNFASYVWSPNFEQTSSIEVWEAGTYSVVVEDPNNGCEATSNEVQVIVNSVTSPSIVPSGDTEFCQGGSVSLSVVPGPYNSILWSSGSTTPSIVVTQTGEYGVTVVDANGCLDSTLAANAVSVTVWNPIPVAVQQGDTVVVSNGPFDQYQWYLNGVMIPGANSAQYVPSISGIYSCEIVDENGCIAESNYVEFTFTGIADLEDLYDVEVYPNPTDGMLNVDITFDRPLDASFQLLDVTGRVVGESSTYFNTAGLIHRFDLGRAGAGIYFVRIQTEDGILVKQVVRR
ncbi:MAG: HYR domain-containing protein [Flavobacteriales bacterium]|nr:HYR domain-containing protein [Flavobacteriales bacterium]